MFSVFSAIIQAKKRQCNLEETYSGSMGELQLLLDTFQPSPGKSSSKPDSQGKKAGSTTGSKIIPP